MISSLKNIALFSLLLKRKQRVFSKSEQYFAKTKARGQDFAMKTGLGLI